MRVFIKEYYFFPTSGNYREYYNKNYIGDAWNFTGRIMYQKDCDGTIQVSFEIVQNNSPSWIDSDAIDFDESSEAVIIECGNNKYNIKGDKEQT